MRLLIALYLLFFSISTQAYPAHWWDPVDAKDKKWWEILPQQANKGEVILSKRNELGLLSNFAKTPFELDGVRYKSLEGFWQMMLFPEGENDQRLNPRVSWEHTRKQVAQMVGFEAKKAGDKAYKNMKKLGINYVSYRGQKMIYDTKEKGEHYKLIKRASWAKIRQNPNVKEVLLKTAGLRLRPDHIQPKEAPPSWKYYEIYTEIRQELLKPPGD